MAVYGDSFALCAEVNDDQTWPRFLEALVGGRVANFGVAGYGTGQALLLAERHWREGAVAPFTILTIYENDVERLTIAFRPLHTGATGIRALAFKPSFRIDAGGELVVQPSAFASADLDVEELHRRALAQDRGSRMRPPFSLQVARLAADRITAIGWGAERHYHPYTESGAAMRRVVARFVDGAQASGSRPVVLFIPSRRTLRKGVPASYQAFARELAEPVLVVDALEAIDEPARFNLRPFKGHASAHGNAVIARAVAEKAFPPATRTTGGTSR